MGRFASRWLSLALLRAIALFRALMARQISASGSHLLQQRSDNHQWGVPGGIIDPGKTPAQVLVCGVSD